MRSPKRCTRRIPKWEPYRQKTKPRVHQCMSYFPFVGDFSRRMVVFLFTVWYFIFFIFWLQGLVLFFTENLSVANAGKSIYPIFSSRGKGISGPSVCQRSATLCYTEDQTEKSWHKYRAVLSQILSEKSFLQSATMSVYDLDGLQPVENPQCFLVLAWFGLWPAAGDLTPATLQNPEVARHTWMAKVATAAPAGTANQDTGLGWSVRNTRARNVGWN